MMKLSDLLDLWATDEGKPYKESLIDMDAWESNPDDIGCMCAQGQVLHLLGGWTPEQLDKTIQYEADRKTAELLNISRAHAVLLRQINDSAEGAPAIVLTDPSKVLGENWSTVLDFWYALDKPQPTTGKDALAAAREAAWEVVGKNAWDEALAAAKEVAGASAKEAAGATAEEDAWEAAWGAAWGYAGEVSLYTAWASAGGSNEIQAAKIFRRDGRAFYFLPLFGFATPEDIPARPDDYGVELYSQKNTL